MLSDTREKGVGVFAGIGVIVVVVVALVVAA